MALSDADKHVKASNARYLFQRSISGKVTGAKSGWQTLTFSRPLRAVPGVTATAEGQGAIVNVRNVTANGFDYQVINTPSGQDINFYWRADMAEMVSSPLIDDINTALGTSFKTIGELLSSNTGMASLAGNETARNLLLGVPDLYPQVANSQNAVNQLFGNDAAYAAVKAKTNLLNQIKGSSWGYSKWWAREAGLKEVGQIVDSASIFAWDGFASAFSDKARADEFLSSDSRKNAIVTSALALWKLVKVPFTRALLNDRLFTRSLSYTQIARSSLSTASDLFSADKHATVETLWAVTYRGVVIDPATKSGLANYDARTQEQEDSAVKTKVPEASYVFLSRWLTSIHLVDARINPDIYDDNGFRNYISHEIITGSNRNVIVAGGMYGPFYEASIDGNNWFASPVEIYTAV